MSETNIQHQFNTFTNIERKELKRLFCELAGVCVDINATTNYLACFTDAAGLGVVVVEVMLTKTDCYSEDNVTLFEGRVNYLERGALEHVANLKHEVLKTLRLSEQLAEAKAAL